MGLLDSILGGSGPDLKVVPLDPGTQKMIGEQVQRATAGPGVVADKMNAGVAQAGQQALATPDQMNQRASQTGEDPSGLQAIRNQYMKTAGDAVGGIVRSNQARSALTQSTMLNQAARSAIAQQQVQTQNYEMMTQAMNAADAARAQVLTSVLGIGGMAAGMYAASPHGKAPSSGRQQTMAGGYGDAMGRSAGGQEEFNIA